MNPTEGVHIGRSTKEALYQNEGEENGNVRQEEMERIKKEENHVGHLQNFSTVKRTCKTGKRKRSHCGSSISETEEREMKTPN